MDFLGIGPLELIFVIIIALIVLGPNDMIKASKTIGRSLRKLVTSQNWRAIQQTSRELRQLPNRLIREAGIEELQKELPTAHTIQQQSGIEEIKKEVETMNKDLSAWTTPPSTDSPKPGEGSSIPKPDQPYGKEQQD
jgi:sec-independent protein translocase protein TatB